MKKFQYTISLMVMLVLAVSCKNNVVKMGEVSYYPKFLWSEEKMDTLAKIYDFNFNADAKAEPSCFAEFTFVDNNGEEIPQQEMIVYVEGEKTENNSFRVNSTDGSKELKFTFTPQAKSGKHQGFLKLTDHNLHIINNQELKPSDTVQVLQWTVHYNKRMNPWAKVLMWFAFVIVAVLFTWFAFLRPALYPHFCTMVKRVHIEQNGRIVKAETLKFTGVREVIFTNAPVKQSLLGRIFIGKTKALIEPWFADPLRFVPRKKGAMAFGSNYTVLPNPIPRNGVAIIKNATQKVEITLK